MMEPVPPVSPALTRPDALRDVRGRYERGEISFEAFREAFDALLKSSTPAEWREIVDRLPVASQNPLADLDAHVRVTEALATEEPPLPGFRAFVAIIGEANRTRRPFRLARTSLAWATIGEVKLDLTLAELPTNGTLWIFAAVGEVVISVPRSVAVTVRGGAVIGELHALGESYAGIVSFGHEASTGSRAATQPTRHLTINALAIVGEIQVRYVDDPVMPQKSAAGEIESLPHRMG